MMFFRRHSKSLWLIITGFIIFYTILHVIIMRPMCMHGVVPLNYFPRYQGTGNEPHNVTVVTAYFNLGRFRKGSDGNFFGPGMYRRWSSVYQYMHNPVVFYTDSDEFAFSFSAMRAHLTETTKVIKVDRTSLWAFQWIHRIREIYSNPEYPKFHPNTVVPEYSCAQHAKYACVEDAISKRHVRTPYVMWIDFGFFRLITERKRPFRMTLPINFDERKIAANQIEDRTMAETPEEIFKGNKLWVGGGFFLGRTTLFLSFIKIYRTAVERYLNMSLSNSDQQVLFAMFTRGERKILHPVDLQLYVWDVFGSCWYYLGYRCYRELSKIQIT